MTIILTRAYLAVTGYPQIGSGSLHIAHALYGGALLVAALVIEWAFLGSRARTTSVVVAGIGFGLFLDEVGKFVTKSNDYFYYPAADIMYLSVMLVVIGGQIIRLARKPTPHESLSNAADIAAQGIASGLGTSRRRVAAALIDRAESQGADPKTVNTIRELLSQCPDSPERILQMRLRIIRWIPSALLAPWCVTLAGWALVLVSLEVSLSSIFHVNFRPSELLFRDTHGGDDLLAISNNSYLVLSGATFLLAGFAMLARRRARQNQTGIIWPLQLLQAVAIAFTLIGAVFDFAQFGFGGLISLGIGLFTMAVIANETNTTIRGMTLKQRADRIRL
ncbi:hypothetical protein [Rhodococcus erythropolis]|uniref:Uncharacterized protein n=1 Tax=Rhodococcus erythropolis TaxID=1833 RepID=A0A8I0ZRG8_RHOER|nr:hypothetical protein [Rhodococcus erythropolis]MBH5141009.1 hypothetical protein [Rhodococcus erythropolis]